ncbi:hypothetical protein E2C01_101640 [Portunus trituberculatus]|uniref:Uncharacterized protein n=1 Tax=Portunus trituberculatus TaxID=210409 RepID=A0A5B7KFD7_PORTR|nr:hypothetical protein [Portunus trituberculatus]
MEETSRKCPRLYSPRQQHTGNPSRKKCSRHHFWDCTLTSSRPASRMPSRNTQGTINDCRKAPLLPNLLEPDTT